MFETLSATIENNIVTFKTPQHFKKAHVMITIVQSDDDMDYGLYEVPDNEVTEEMRVLSKKALSTPISNLDNI